MQNETLRLRMLMGESRVFPLVRYPINPRHRTLLHGQMPAIRPKMKMPGMEGSKVTLSEEIGVLEHKSCRLHHRSGKCITVI